MVVAVNVLVTLVDLWVTKDARFLHASLWFHGHDLTLVGLLYHRQVEPQPTIDDGGDFDHLLPVHQKFYATVKKINQAHHGNNRRPQSPYMRYPRPAGGPRGFIAADVPEISDYDTTMGRDPLDANAWYVNHDPVHALRIGLDLLAADYHFDIVIILVPQNDSVDDIVTNMVEEVKAKQLLLLVVKLPDHHHVYYQDENYFRVQQPDGRNLRRNEMCRNIRFTNRQVRAFLARQSFATPEHHTLVVDTLVEELRLRWRHPLRYRHSRPSESQQVLGWGQ